MQHVTAANLTGPAAVRAADTFTIGAALTLCREYGRRWEDFAALRPDMVRPIIPAAPLRAFLIGGAA